MGRICACSRDALICRLDHNTDYTHLDKDTRDVYGKTHRYCKEDEERAVIVVIDSVGVSPTDAHLYGDEENTVPNAKAMVLTCPAKLGFETLFDSKCQGEEPPAQGKMAEVSKGKINNGALGNCRY